MTAPRTDRPVATLLADAAWLPHRYDPGHDAVQFVQAARAARAAIPFLTDDYLPTDREMVAIRRAEALAEAPPARPLHLILHSAYCCSTLLANVLDQPGIASAVKEPVILNDLVGWRHRGAPGAKVAEVLDGALHLLARPFERGEAVVVKPSNVVNGLGEAMLKLRPDARCLLLHAPLRDYVTSIARKGIDGRLWVRDLLAKQLLEGMVQLGIGPDDYLKLTDLQVAAVGWLAQADLFARLVRQWPARVRTLNSEVLIAEPEAVLGAIDQLFRLGAGAEDVARMAQSPAFGADAKTGRGFAAGQREAAARTGAELHADEIGKVVAWAEAVAARAGVATTLPGALLG